MAISFNDVPDAWRVPGYVAEFDSSRAQQGAGIIEYKALVCGQMLTGTAEPLKPYLVTSDEQAQKLFGAGSQLALMLAGWRENNTTTRLMAMAVTDDESGVKAEAAIQLSGTVTQAAPVNLYIGGIKVRFAAALNQSAAQVAQAAVAAINAEAGLPVTAASSGGEDGTPVTVTLTAKNAGEAGNELDLRLAYNDEDMPRGLTWTPGRFAKGAGNPDSADLIAALGDAWYHIFVLPWTDKANLRAWEDELVRRFGPMVGMDGVAFCARSGTLSELVTFGSVDDSGGNYAHISIMESSGSPDIPAVRAARVAAKVAYYGAIDPARPFQTLELTGSLAPADADQLTQEERNLLLHSGIAATRVSDGGTVLIERVITNYQRSAAGAADTAYLDVNTLLTLMYIRWDWVNRLARKYPRHKLMDDGNPIPAGQAVMTPKLGRAEAVAAFMDWQELCLVENLDQFKADLVVERNSRDPNRMDMLMPPDLVNQLRFWPTLIQFRL